MNKVYRVFDITKSDLCEFAPKAQVLKLKERQMREIANCLRNAIIQGAFWETTLQSLLDSYDVADKYESKDN